jgi:hypothetical protein
VLFLRRGRIEYWENIESASDEVIEVLLSKRLSAGNWEAAEAWAQDKLICRIAGIAIVATAEPSEQEEQNDNDNK